MKRTIENCSLVKRMVRKGAGEPERVGAKPGDFEHPAEDYDGLAMDLFADDEVSGEPERNKT